MDKDGQKTKKAERVPRGTVPPTLRLSEAITLAHKVNERASGSASYDLFSQITGNTKTSSSFQRKVSALRLYGIIEDRDNIVSLSEIGNRIVTPKDESDDALAIKESMLRLDLLNKIYDRHRGRILPEDHFLNNVLLQDLKVPREFSRAWVDYFKDAATAARLIFVRGDGKMQLLDEPAGSITVVSGAAPPASPVAPSSSPPASNNLELSGSLPIPLGPGRIALLKLPEDWSAHKDLKRLLKMLELSLGEEVDQEDES